MDAVIVQGVRTPFCKIGTALEPLAAVDLGLTVVRECLYRAELEPARLDAVVLGTVAQPAEAANLARVVALSAGVPHQVPALTLSRNCGSGMEAVVEAARLIRTGEAEAVMACGVESMSHVPVLYADGFRRFLLRWKGSRSMSKRLGLVARFDLANLEPVSALLSGLTDPVSGLDMGQTAEVLARELGIGREAQDRFAARSQERAAAARARGVFDAECMPVYTSRADAVVAEDVGPRADSTLERLARLRPVFDRRFGTVTAGNASMLTDGAVALLVMAGERARSLGYTPLARLRAHAVVGCDPRRMGLGPAYAIPALLARAEVSLGDVDLVEINEAFAVQVLACVQALASETFAAEELGLARPPGLIPDERLNVNGGAIALGHPVGASGARLVLTLALEMRRRRANLGLASLCVGGGQGQAVLLARE